MKKSIAALLLLLAVCLLSATSAKAAAYTVTVNLSAFSNDYMTAADYVIANTEVKVNGLFRLLPHDTNWYGNGKVFTGTPGAVQSGDHVFYFNRLPDFYQAPPFATNIASDGARNFYFRPYSNSLTIAVSGQADGVPITWTLSAYPAEFTNSSAFRVNGTNTTTLTPIPTGTYAVTFPLRLQGYTMPPTTNIEVSATRQTAITNWYLPYSNVMAVTIAGLSTTNNASWSLTGPDEFTNAVNYATTYTNVFTVDAIPDGLYTISFPAVLGYSTPPAVYTNITGTPLTNSVLGNYVAVTWGGETNPASTNPPVGSLPTNFPVQTNDITLMVTTNGLFKTPAKAQIIAANGLAVTNDPLYQSILKTMTNWVPVASSTNYLIYDPDSRTLSGCITNENTGPQGPQGIPGSNGLDGATGPAGSNGMDGAQGTQGPQGPAGSNGLDGAVGPQGLPGSNGVDGAQGPPGSNGVDGAVGPQGPPGPVTNQIMAVNGVLYTITNAPPAAGRYVMGMDPASSTAWFEADSVSVFSTSTVPGVVTSSNSLAPPTVATIVDYPGTEWTWSSPDYALAEDGNITTLMFMGGGATDWLYLNDFGFAIPTNMTIDGIEVKIKANYLNNPTFTFAAQLRDGDSYSTTNMFSFDNAGLEWRTNGSPSDKWGVNWTPEQINSTNFSLILWGNDTAYNDGCVDYATVNVYCHITGPDSIQTNVATMRFDPVNSANLVVSLNGTNQLTIYPGSNVFPNPIYAPGLIASNLTIGNKSWTNLPTGSTTNLVGMVWDNGATTGTLHIVEGVVTVSVP